MYDAKVVHPVGKPFARHGHRKTSEPIANATEYRNVRYLPDWRYADDPSPERDGQIVMDIVVPDDGKDRHPVLFVVHGGGWPA